MLHPKYLREGSRVEIPELSGYVEGDLFFNVLGVFAGGMGVCVHLHHCATGVQYALKGVRPHHIGNQAAADRFLVELQVWLSASMCSLVAEAIAVVRINETPCVVGIWMPKGDLAHALPNFTPRQKLETLIRMVRGLSWVLDNLGIIHRDLKPANVLLDMDNLAYVADWGLARPIGHALAGVRASLGGNMLGRPNQTQAGSFLGTVTYAAPEQILGAKDIDHRADIYALGCMMFEFETGLPPFTGRSVAEIARHHIQTPPPQIGGWFKKRTELGLEKVIAKCLLKNPGARFSTYEELENVLVGIARQQGVAPDRCVATKRYERMPLGKGHSKQAVVLDRAPVKGKDGYAVVEHDDISPFLEEANNLIALNRFDEAELLLRPHFVPDFVGFDSDWLPNHSVALNYAYCLLRIGKRDDAMAILARLDTVKKKPAEFYVNYSLSLLYVSDWQVAKDVCLRGLRHFPEDTGILGNQTIALLNSDDLDGAHESAIRRLNLRRDIHGIEEAVGVLQRQAEAKRDADLPNAIATAKIAGDLIKEGLKLNPRFYSLRLKEIQLRRFAHDEAKVLELYQAMMDADDCPISYRQLAFAEMVEKLAEGKLFKNALDLLQRSGESLSERLLALKMRTLARHFMIGKDNTNEQRIVIPEVRDYFLGKSSTQLRRDPVIAAEILEWLNDPRGALEVLEQHLSAVPNDWEGIRITALIHLRMGKHDRALHFAQSLAKIAPWRSESYDWLSYVCQQVNKPEIAKQAKQQGDEAFEREKVIFDDFRAYLDA